jgi:hypothetical protein
MKKVFFVILFLILVSTVTFAASPEPADTSWLNGKWEGRPPAGGELTMALTVEKDNQIRGTAVIPGGGRKGAHPEVTGTLKGKRVTLETFFPSAFPQSVVHYDCTSTNDALQCRTKSGYKTTFKKVE